MDISHLFHSSFDRNLYCSHILTITKNAAMNIYSQVLYGHIFSFLLGICQGVELLDHMVILCLTFKGTTGQFSFSFSFLATPHGLWDLNSPTRDLT